MTNVAVVCLNLKIYKLNIVCNFKFQISATNWIFFNKLNFMIMIISF